MTAPTNGDHNLPYHVQQEGMRQHRSLLKRRAKLAAELRETCKELSDIEMLLLASGATLEETHG